MKTFIFFSVAALSVAARSPLVQNIHSSSAPLYSAENAEIIPGQYIVVFKPHANAWDIENHHNFLVNLHAIDVLHVYEMKNLMGYAGRLSHEALEEIRSRPEVAYVEQDQIVKANEIQHNAPWGLARISHRDSLTFRTYNKYLHDPSRGENVTAYIIDTGVSIKHRDFGGRATWGATIPENDEDVDGNGHGTHVAGTVAGQRFGVAKKANIVAVKVLRSNGSGTNSDVIRGIEWAMQDHQRRNGRSVANMSLGGGYSRSLNAAVDAAVDAGVHFVVAAGNDDYDACDNSPASAESAITVGASTIDDGRAWFSNKGKCVDVFAPGKDILSAWIGSNTATNTISGTSMASPHVAGLVAYLLHNESPADIRKRVLSMATRDILSDIPADTPNILVFNGY